MAPLKSCNLPPIDKDFAIPAPPETIKPPVLTVAESTVDVDAIPEAVNPIPMIFPNTAKVLVV